MSGVIALGIIVLLYFTPLNIVLYKYLYNCIGNIINRGILKEIFIYIPFIKDNIQGRVTWILFFVIVVSAPLIISKVIKFILNFIDYEFYNKVNNRYRNYLYKYTRGTKEINYILMLGVTLILIIMKFLRIGNVRIYALGILLITYVFRVYKKGVKQNNERIKEDRRYKKVKSITKKVVGAEYKVLKWKYIIDHCLVELPIEFQANVRINDSTILKLPNGYLVEVTINDLAKEIENACRVKGLNYKNKINVVLSLFSEFKYEVEVVKSNYKEGKQNEVSHLEDRIDDYNEEKVYELKTPRKVIETGSGNGVELGKCAISIFRAMGIDVEEIELPRKDGENKVALFIEGADIEQSDNYYVKDNKKYYYCEILRDNKYFIGEKL